MFKLTSEMQIKPFDPVTDDAEEFSDGALMFGSDGKMYKALAIGNNPAYEVLHDLTSFVDSSAISAALTGYATETFVTSQGYQDATDVSNAISTALVGNATQAWVSSNYYDKSTVYTKVETVTQIESGVQDNRELVRFELYTGQGNTMPKNYLTSNPPYYETMEIAATEANITFLNGAIVSSITGNKHNHFRCKVINYNSEGTSITVTCQNTGTSDPKFVIPQDSLSGQTSFTIPAGKVAEIFYTTNSSAGDKFCVIYS